MARPTSRHSFWSLVWGALTFAVLHASASWWLPEWVEPQRDPNFFVRRDQLVRRLASAQTLSAERVPLAIVLGTSRTFSGLDGATAEASAREIFGHDVRVANFGTPGGNLLSQHILLGRLLRSGITPDAVIVEVLPTQLQKENFDSLFHTQNHTLLESDLNWLEATALAGKLGKCDDLGWPSFWAYRRELLQLVAPTLLLDGTVRKRVKSVDPYGGRVSTTNVVGSEENRAKAVAMARTAYKQALEKFAIKETGPECLRILLYECKRRSIPTAVVLMPEGPVFRSWYRPGARQQIVARVREVAEATDAQLIDAWTWFDNEEHFRDSHHLVGSSSKSFADRLVRTALPAMLKPVENVAGTAGGSIRR